jgi:pantoate kinase
MTIETKYQSGNKVWFLLNNKVIEKQVLQTLIEEVKETWANKSKIKIEYKVETGGGYGITKLIEEKYLFPSKEELLNSL